MKGGCISSKNEFKTKKNSKGPQTYRFFPQQRRLDGLGGKGFRSRRYIEKMV